MFVNVNKLHAKLKEFALTRADVAEQMGIDRSTLYRKLGNSGAGLTVKDAQQLVIILQLTEEEALEIFFAREVA
jgi:predicted transcriptional regulator